MKWISVKDKLPDKENINVMILSNVYSHYLKGNFWQPVYYSTQHKWCFMHDEILDESEFEVTHWMIIPDRDRKKKS